MTVAKAPFANFAEYVALDPADLPEGRYEYWDGDLVPVMSESGLNDAIANYLFILLVNAGFAPRLIRPHSCEVEVPGRPRTRLPDLVILDEAHIPLIARRNTITREMPPPRLVVEVVSPGKQNRERDLVEKRQQYAELGIPEYWLIDPENAQIIVLQLIQTGTYAEVGVFSGDDAIASIQFPQLQLTAAQVLNAGE